MPPRPADADRGVAPAGAGRWPLLALLLLPALPACSSGPPPAPPGPPVDAAEVASTLQLRTRLPHPMRIVFDWSLNEQGSRARGRGVARLEPPYNARLDLFAENGEAVVSAAVVGDQLRLPPGARTEIIPQPNLLWAALGVFRPGDRAVLVGGESDAGGGIDLHYRTAGTGQLHYRLQDRRLEWVERLRDGHAVERVEIQPGDAATPPREATYRNLAAFRELQVTVDTVERVEAFPPDIWTPGR